MGVNVAVIPASGAPLSVNVRGRVYTSTIGAAPLIVPDFDAFVLTANGWMLAAKDGAGTTAQRPVASYGVAPPPTGYRYFDSDVGAMVIWNGKNWINHATGATA
jgi:hypothetical protein